MPDAENVRQWIVHVTGPATYVPPGKTESRPSPYAGRKFAVKVTLQVPQSPISAGRPAPTFLPASLTHPAR